MNALGLSAVLALLAGTLAYATLRWAWPTVAIAHFVNIIGLAAIAGGVLGAWWSRRRTAGPTARPPPPSGTHHD